MIKSNLSPCHNCRTLLSTLGPGAAVVQCGEGGAARNYVRVQQRGSNIHLHLTGTNSWPMVWSVSRITLDTISISDIYCIYIRAIYLWEIFQHKGRVSTWESHWDIIITYVAVSPILLVACSQLLWVFVCLFECWGDAHYNYYETLNIINGMYGHYIYLYLQHSTMFGKYGFDIIIKTLTFYWKVDIRRYWLFSISNNLRNIRLNHLWIIYSI